MLHHLSIRNIVLIESLDIAFARGLCVLTGETGAGKSILLDALGFVLGERVAQKLLRHGATQGSVTAEFTTSGNGRLERLLEEQGIIQEECLTLRRIITPDGKTKAFANDIPISVNLLKQIGTLLLEIHGQHEQRGLLEPATHQSIIDAYMHLDALLLETSASYHAWKENQQKLEELKHAEQAAQWEEDYLRHVANELSELAPCEGEEETLAEERTQLMGREKLLTILESALNELSGTSNNITSTLFSAQKQLMRGNALTVPGQFDAAIEALERASVEVQEAVESLESIAQQMDMGNSRLEIVEERLFALRAAARKFNMPVDALPGYKAEIDAKLLLLEDQSASIVALTRQVEQSKAHYSHYAERLSAARHFAAKQLEEALHTELIPLKMAATRFTVQITPLPEQDWAAHGQDKVTFLASTNPGSPLAPLAKIASGGELSRFMLAIKVALAGVNSTPTLIFDEVDTGIGGAVADAVGKRLQLLGEHVQVLVVTHQPQVAARGNTHLKVQKTTQGDTTITSATVLSQAERKEELARMLAGEHITPEARAAANKLLEMSAL